MYYNDSTFASGGGIIQRNEMLCSMGNGAISGDTTLLKQFTMLNNLAYYEVWMAEMKANRVWKADDFNYTDLPDAPITLVASQSDYTIPVAVTSANVATFLRLNGVYYTQNGTRYYLEPMGVNDTYFTTAGVPTKYGLNGKSIRFNIPPSSTFVSTYTTFHLEFQRVPDAFTSSDTTQQPGFMETYHDLIPLKSSALYLMPIDPNTATRYDQQFYARLELFKGDVANLDDSFGRNMTSEYINPR